MKCFLGVLFLVASLLTYAQNDKVHWLTIEEAWKKYEETPKPIMIDFYTDWCGWCKQMDQTTYENPTVISYLNQYFYPVKVNAESSDTLLFRDKKYLPVKNGSRNISSLAVEMLGGQLSYPTTVFLHDKEKIKLVVPGYLDVPKMEAFIIYFTENAFQTCDVNDFIMDFEKTFVPGEKSKTDTLKTYWTDFKDLETKRAEKKKKILLYLHAPWNNSSRIMDKLVFPDSVFSAVAQKYYYCLQLDIQSPDSVTFMTHRFVNTGETNNNLHQLAIALSDKLIRVPGVYIFDEDGKLMEQLFYYTDKRRGTMVLDYIGSDLYKSMAWEDYVKVKAKEDF